MQHSFIIFPCRHGFVKNACLVFHSLLGNELCCNRSGYAFLGALTSVDALFFIAQNCCGDTFYRKEEKRMPDYEKMYFELFNGVTDIIEDLKKLQQKAEENYIEAKEEN